MTNQSSPPKIHTKKHIARLERERQQVRLIQTISIIAIAAVILVIGYGILDASYLSLRKPVAEVNGEKISVSYWSERVQLARMNLVQNLNQYQFYQQNFGMDTTQQIQQIQTLLQASDILGGQVLTQLVNETLIRQEAEKRGITVTKAEVDERIQGSLNYYPNGTAVPTITPTEFSLPTLTAKQKALYGATATPTEVLTVTPAPTNTPDAAATATFTALPASPTPLPLPATATATPYTPELYEDQYAKSLENLKNNGVSEATFFSATENQIYREKLLAEITKDLPRTTEQALARHILVDDQEQADKVYSLVTHGRDFAEAAKEFSKDTGSGANGGDLGWFGKGAMVAEFEQAAFSQPIGEIGTPVQSQFGFHIIQVIAREELPSTDSEYQQNRETAFTEWLTKTNEEATTTGTVILYEDTWKANVPPLPASLAQALQ